jgi:predicted RNA-binding Zn-ribbon protein involved in translation (DUF1610 family)
MNPPLGGQQMAEMTCPKCGFKQPQMPDCIKCGIVIEKYLKSMIQQVGCPECNKIYRIPKSKIPDKGSYATCKECGCKIHIKQEMHKAGNEKPDAIPEDTEVNGQGTTKPEDAEAKGQETPEPEDPKEQVLMTAKGKNGQLELLENKIRIKREGTMSFLTHGFKGEKEILIKQISSIQFKPTGNITAGYIQFAFIGGQEGKGAIWEAARDENTIMFNLDQQPDFEKIKKAIEDRIVSSQEGTPKSSGLDDLEKLANLHEKGIITEEEFNAKKKQILGL